MLLIMLLTCRINLAHLQLGLSMVRSVSISLCIISPFNSLNKCPAFDIEYFWSCALLTTEGTTMLASSTTDTSALNTSTFHTAGLLHNLGMLWLAGNWPEETSLALELATTDDSISTIEAFRSVIRTDYCQAGGILSRSWKLLEVLISAMEQHCHCVYSESTCQNTVLIGYAVDMVSALFRGQEERPQPR